MAVNWARINTTVALTHRVTPMIHGRMRDMRAGSESCVHGESSVQERERRTILVSAECSSRVFEFYCRFEFVPGK